MSDADVKTPTAETHSFQAEVAELLRLMVHSVYSETDIFLRELISNASDACDRLRYEAIARPELTADGAPLALDAAAAAWPVTQADAIVSINMIHIAPWSAAEGLMAGAARLLPPDSPLYLYGPFREHGRHTAPSNAAFDESLKARDPAWGVRDLDEVVALASRHGLALSRTVAMPANNLSVIFRRNP